jgi:hypothetical protein
MMQKSLNIQELTIVVVAKNHNPTILNPDFLKHNGIVSKNWELARPPLCAEPVSQVVYKNGINIVAQFEKVIFTEMIRGGKEQIRIPSIASKYVETLPHVDYQAVGINPKGDVFFTKGELDGFFWNRLIRPGRWSKFKEETAQVGVRFIYPTRDGSLTLTLGPE